MSKLRQGVLRAVRLLPDAIKIGVEPQTALPSSQEEEQISSGEISHDENAAVNKAEKADKADRADRKKISGAPGKKEEVSSGASKVSEKKAKENDDNEATRAILDLTGRLAALQTKANEASAVEQSLRKKIASLETDLSSVKNAAAQKERELNATIDAAREQARAEGKAQGHEEGLKSGHAAGMDKANAEAQARYREKFSGLVATLEGISAKLEKDFAGLVELNQPRMLRLWQEMLKKMLRREMTMTPDSVLDVLSDVLSRLSDKNRILIYVSPEDLELLQARLQEEFEDILRGVKHLELKPDTSVDKGSCLVETNLGVYDARWRTQLDQIEMSVEKLLQQMGKTPRPKAPPARLSQANHTEEKAEEKIEQEIEKKIEEKLDAEQIRPASSSPSFIPSSEISQTPAAAPLPPDPMMEAMAANAMANVFAANAAASAAAAGAADSA